MSAVCCTVEDDRQSFTHDKDVLPSFQCTLDKHGSTMAECVSRVSTFNPSTVHPPPRRYPATWPSCCLFKRQVLGDLDDLVSFHDNIFGDRADRRVRSSSNGTKPTKKSLRQHMIITETSSAQPQRYADRSDGNPTEIPNRTGRTPGETRTKKKRSRGNKESPAHLPSGPSGSDFHPRVGVRKTRLCSNTSSAPCPEAITTPKQIAKLAESEDSMAKDRE